MAGRSPLGRHWRGRPPSVWLLVGLLAQLGVSGLAGGAQFMLVPSGAVVGLTPAALAGSPFADYLVPGVVLFGVLGVAPLAVAYGLYRGRRWGPVAAVAVGVALATWVVVEGLVVGFGRRLQYPHLVQAALIVAVAETASVRGHCDDEDQGT